MRLTRSGTTARLQSGIKRLSVALPLVLAQACSQPSGQSDGNGTAPVDPTPTQQTQNTYSVGGRITAFEQNQADSDVNDPNAAYKANDPALSNAQDLPNPVTVGGYVNLPGQGFAGRSFDAGDSMDIYRVDLLANQVINLHMAGDPDQHDLDLYLYDKSGALVDASADVSGQEWLTVNTAGLYYIVVEAFNGVPTTATHYTMTIGLDGANPAASPAASALHLSDAFIVGEAHVQWQPQSVAQKGGTTLMQTFSKAYAAKQKAGDPNRSLLFQLDLDKTGGFNKAGILQAEPSVKNTTFTLEQQEKLKTLMALKAMRRDKKAIQYAEPNHIVTPLAVPNDPYYSLQWHYPMINLPQTWDITTGDSNVVVAVVDTGVLLGFPDLQGQLIAGYDFISPTSISKDGDGIDNNPDDPGDGGGGKASSFHGTHVAGTIAAASNNSNGVAGVAWNVKIMPVRVLGAGGGTGYDVLQGVRYAAGLSNDSGSLPSKAADVINLSLGGSGYSSISQAVYTQAYNNGVIVVAAAGNNGTSEWQYPASYDNVISVSAANIRKGLSYFSSYGSKVDVAAPGGDMRSDLNGDGYGDGILSTVGNDSKGFIQFVYAYYQGTSMATPHMAGVVALMKSINPELTPAQLDPLLASGGITEDLGQAGRDDQFGYGLIDAYKAVTEAAKLGGGNPIPEPAPSLKVSNSALNFGSQLLALNLTAGNGGAGNLSLQNVATDQTWLTVTPVTVDANGLGTYTVAVNRDGLSVGTHGGVITFTSDANAVTVTVIMQVAENPLAGNAGIHYILLIDTTTFVPVAQASASATNGWYDYNFDTVTPGSYYLVAGSDSNNDGYICDTGEACGGYPSLYDLAPVSIDQSGQFDFNSGFNFHLIGISVEQGATQRNGWKRLQ